MGCSEADFIRWATDGGRGTWVVGPGDDAALLEDGLVVALDTVVEGTHFDPGTDPALVTRKALGACLSDLCAMGAVASSVFVSAQIPVGAPAEALARGLAEAARAYGVELAGGDTVTCPAGALAFAVTATGRCAGPPWLRSGGRPGDQLVVTGPLGGSRLGRHLTVEPRADVVAWFRQREATVHACMDLSDGLAADLPRLCAASGVGARVEADLLPIHPDAADRGPQAALGDGEDFELLLAVPTGSQLPEGSVIIGELRPQGEMFLAQDGRDHPWPDDGHVHAF